MAATRGDEPVHTKLLDARDEWPAPHSAESVVVAEHEATGGLVYAMYGDFDHPTVPPVTRFWTGSEWQSVGAPKRRLVFFLRQPADFVKLAAPNEPEFTLSLFAPMFMAPVGTGETIREVAASVRDLWRGSAAPEAPLSLATPTTQLVDVPAALRQARSQAGLPVQDLAAMFGIGRRQFYNLVSGEQHTDDARAPRIARVTDVVERISEWVGGNTRKVRALLLARLDGDSIYDAAVADDEHRIGRAVERAYLLAGEAMSLPRLLPPSHRATSGEAAAMRGYLRATRDETGAPSDG